MHMLLLAALLQPHPVPVERVGVAIDAHLSTGFCSQRDTADCKGVGGTIGFGVAGRYRLLPAFAVGLEAQHHTMLDEDGTILFVGPSVEGIWPTPYVEPYLRLSMGYGRLSGDSAALSGLGFRGSIGVRTPVFYPVIVGAGLSLIRLPTDEICQDKACVEVIAADVIDLSLVVGVAFW